MPPACPKKEHGLTIILGMDIKNHLKSIKSDISIVVIKPEPGTSITNYVNGINFLGTVLTITEASEEVINLLPNLKNIGSRKNVRTVDIIGFLKTNGVKLTPLANNYENIMTTDHKSPIIIEYSVTRHSFESTDLPPSWIQFCILFQKEKLLVPFNGEVRVKLSAISKIYHWDRQTLCTNPDFLPDKTGLTSKVPFFCSNFNSKRSSNSTNLLITMASLHSIAAMASFV
jgi:hypothetical protein